MNPAIKDKDLYVGRVATTAELVELLVKNKRIWIEACLNTRVFRCCHMMVFGGRKIFDIGIDSQEVTWKPDEFVKFYDKAYWEIEQIVPSDEYSHPLEHHP